VPRADGIAHDGRVKLTRTTIASVLVLGASLLAACGDDDGDDAAPPSAADLDGRTFVATEVDGQELVEGTSISLSFEDERISVNAGCNTMNGGYALADGTLEAPQLAQTMMACDEALMAQDEWIAALLAGGAEVTLSGDELTLAGDDVTVTATAAS
jgi:heat shock protein HslJ